MSQVLAKRKTDPALPCAGAFRDDHPAIKERRQHRMKLIPTIHTIYITGYSPNPVLLSSIGALTTITKLLNFLRICSMCIENLVLNTGVENDLSFILYSLSTLYSHCLS